MRPAMPRNPGRIPTAWWHGPRRRGKASTFATWSPTSPAVTYTVKLEDMRSEDSDAIFCSGGHGPIWDLAGDPNSIVLIESFYTSGEPVTAVCHAPAVLHQLNYQGTPIAKAKRVLGFANSEDELTDVIGNQTSSTRPSTRDGTVGSASMTRNGSGRMDENEIRKALNRHWAASDANDFDVEHDIYREDAVLEYPQSGERIRGRHHIQASRAAQPNAKRFTVRRIVGSGDLWVTEFILTYDGRPSYSVSVMEFLEGKVARETQYFGDPFEPGPSRAQWVERIG